MNISVEYQSSVRKKSFKFHCRNAAAYIVFSTVRAYTTEHSKCYIHSYASVGTADPQHKAYKKKAYKQKCIGMCAQPTSFHTRPHTHALHTHAYMSIEHTMKMNTHNLTTASVFSYITVCAFILCGHIFFSFVSIAKTHRFVQFVIIF